MVTFADEMALLNSREPRQATAWSSATSPVQPSVEGFNVHVRRAPSPTMPARPVYAAPPGLRHPPTSIASVTALRVVSSTMAGRLTTLETVPTETPAVAATSFMVTVPSLGALFAALLPLNAYFSSWQAHGCGRLRFRCSVEPRAGRQVPRSKAGQTVGRGVN